MCRLDKTLHQLQKNQSFYSQAYGIGFAFSALTLLVGRQEQHLAQVVLEKRPSVSIKGVQKVCRLAQ